MYIILNSKMCICFNRENQEMSTSHVNNQQKSNLHFLNNHHKINDEITCMKRQACITVYNKV